MNVNDPIGDMITRIRNAQQRTKSKVSTPGSKLRRSVLEVLKSEGYIRDYSTVEHSDGRSEFEIELKCVDGEGRDGGSRRPRRQCRRRNPLYGVLRGPRCHVSARNRLRSRQASPPM